MTIGAQGYQLIRKVLNPIPQAWTVLYASPERSINNVKVYSIGVINDSGGSRTVDFRLNGVEVFSIEVAAGDSHVDISEAVMAPGDVLEVQSGGTDTAAYFNGSRSSKWNRHGIFTYGGLTSSPVVLYEHPIIAESAIMIHDISVVRVSGNGNSSVEVIITSAEGDDLTLFQGTLSNNTSLQLKAAAYIMVPGDVLKASASAHVNDIGITYTVLE